MNIFKNKKAVDCAIEFFLGIEFKGVETDNDRIDITLDDLYEIRIYNIGAVFIFRDGERLDFFSTPPSNSVMRKLNRKINEFYKQKYKL